ncbi:MAG: hypothetical protein KAS49_05640 [Candidatus Cloacimonetes bacterium]|nr:hypothetical protein [Candidatus Cloacimonadota bacterium]
MNLQIGLIGKHVGIESILRQEGLPYRLIVEIDDLNVSDYALLICLGNFSLDPQKISNYLANGGAVLFDSTSYAKLKNLKFKKRKVNFLTPNSAEFLHVGLVDIYSKISIVKSESLKVVDAGLKIQKFKNNAIVIPFDIDNLLFDSRIKRKRFIAEREELASERVSVVSKAGVRKILLRCLEMLFEARNLPMVQKWYFPKLPKTHFIFRVDTDFCDEKEANDLLAICRKHNIIGSWFVDTKQTERLKNCYSKMIDQEIGLHCFQHLVFDDYAKNKENIDAGKANLDKANITYHGFVSPLGEWNTNLEKALVDTGFLYSSEFGFDYDNLPSVQKNGDRTILQIPIHPISTGRMRRSHFSMDEMIAYYKKVIDEKVKNHELIVFYHHPGHPHLPVFDKVFAYINKLDIPTSTMMQFASWWKKRDEIEINPTYENDVIKLDSTPHINIRIYYKNKETVVAAKNRITLTELDFTVVNKTVDDEKRARQFHWRDLLYDYETAKGKRFTKKKIEEEK